MGAPTSFLMTHVVLVGAVPGAMRFAPFIRLHGDGVDDDVCRAHDRHDDDVRPPVTNVRFPWHRDAQRITEPAANDDIMAVIWRFWKEKFS
jgi:hypothetical protein